MKNRIICTLILLLALCGCNLNTSNKLQENIDTVSQENLHQVEVSVTDLTFPRTHNGAYFASSDNAVYLYSLMVQDGINSIYYIDKESGIYGPLCGRPDCEHNSPSCNAYIVGTPDGLSVIEDRLYWLDWGTREVKSCKLDGTEHTIIRNLSEWVDISPSGNQWQALFYRNTLYLCRRSISLSDGQLYSISVYAVSLTDDTITTILDEEIEASAGTMHYFNMQAFEDDVYLTCEYSSYEGTFDPEKGEAPTDYQYFLRYYKWNTNEKKVQELYNGTTEFIAYESSVHNNEIYLSVLNGNGISADHIYKYDDEEKEWKTVFSISTAEDEEVILASFTDDFIVFWGNKVIRNDYRRAKIWIADYSGNIISTCIIDNGLVDGVEKTFGRNFIGFDGDCFYFELSLTQIEGRKTAKNSFIVSVPIDGGDANPLIERVN